MRRLIEAAITGQRRQKIALTASALAAGFCSTFLGVANTVALNPALRLRCRHPRAGTTASIAGVTMFVALTGLLAEWELSSAPIRWSWVPLLSVGWFVGRTAGRAVVRMTETPPRVTGAVALLILAWRMWAGAPETYRAVARAISAFPPTEAALVLATGLLAGVGAILFGLAGGLVAVPMLTLLFADPSSPAIRVTSLAAVAVIAAVELRQEVGAGHRETSLTRVLVPSGLAGAVLGVVFANVLPAVMARLAFVALLALAAFELLALEWRFRTLGADGAGLSHPRGRRRSAGAVRSQP